MKFLSLLFPALFRLRALGVVDRVEGPMAVVEWQIDAATDVPLALLPPDIREGDRLRVHLSLADHGLALALDDATLLIARPAPPAAFSLVVPPGIQVQPGHRYELRLAALSCRRSLSALSASPTRVGRAGRPPTLRPHPEVIPL